MKWKPVHAACAAILILLPAHAEAFRLEEIWQKSFPVGPNPRFELENVNGNIRVEAWEGSSIEVTAEIRIKAPSKGRAHALREGVQFVTESDAARISVKTVLPRVRQDAFPGLTLGEHSLIRVRYYIRVPRGTALAVNTVNGDIELAFPADALAKVDAHAVHGRVSQVPLSR